MSMVPSVLLVNMREVAVGGAALRMMLSPPSPPTTVSSPLLPVERVRAAAAEQGVAADCRR